MRIPVHRESVVPMVDGKSFVTEDRRPILSSDTHVIANEESFYRNFSIILQGPIVYKSNFTLETVRIYKKTFLGCVIIVSTWDTEKEDILVAIEAEGAIVLRNPVPPKTGLDNMNYQILSTQAGLNKARELGIEYVIKSRTDQRYYESNIPEFLLNIIKTFPVSPDLTSVQRERLVVISFNSFRYRLYDVSDMFLFGHIDDVIKFWSCALFIPTSLGDWKNIKEFCQKRPAEIYFTTEYIIKCGHEVKWTLHDSWDVYARYFCVIDADSLGLYWPKHSNLSKRWRNFFGVNPHLEELTFKEWLNLYCGRRPGIISDYFIENFPCRNKNYILLGLGENLRRALLGEFDFSGYVVSDIKQWKHKEISLFDNAAFCVFDVKTLMICFNNLYSDLFSVLINCDIPIIVFEKTSVREGNDVFYMSLDDLFLKNKKAILLSLKDDDEILSSFLALRVVLPQEKRPPSKVSLRRRIKRRLLSMVKTRDNVRN